MVHIASHPLARNQPTLEGTEHIPRRKPKKRGRAGRSLATMPQNTASCDPGIQMCWPKLSRAAGVRATTSRRMKAATTAPARSGAQPARTCALDLVPTSMICPLFPRSSFCPGAWGTTNQPAVGQRSGCTRAREWAGTLTAARGQHELPAVLGAAAQHRPLTRFLTCITQSVN